MKEMWNERYADSRYAYGKEPNQFLKSVLSDYKVNGDILFPAEGEGRNAVYAAKKELSVFAFDISEEGRKKAMKLCEQEHVSIHYEVGNFLDLDIVQQSYDAAALIYAHFPPHLLGAYYQKIGELIKPDGLIILEGFSKTHLPYREQNPGIGGPDKIEMLFSTETITQLFPDFTALQLEDVEVELNEGLYHIGTGKVIRFIGRKKH